VKGTIKFIEDSLTGVEKEKLQAVMKESNKENATTASSNKKGG
jgi:hypothetical protein